MNKQQLASKIWESANKMRSKIEANEYKDYILGFIFYKFLSDNQVKWLLEHDWEEADLPEATEEDTETVESVRNSVGYFISYENLFSTWIAKGKDFKASNVTDALSAFSRLISPSHKKVFTGIFATLETGLSKLGETSDARTKAISGLLYLINDIPTDGKQGYDVLGFIYEYLISNFAANAGKKAGEFYTPHEVSLLMSEIVAKHLQGREEIKIYDPTSGSGSLLINIGKSVARHMGSSSGIKYYAQELKENTYNLTRMNLVMRGIVPSNIVTRNGDTLEKDWPYFEESDPVGTYDPLYVDAVVSNPPYSQNWDPKDKENDPRFAFGLAPKSKADYAFLLHDLYHLKPNGIMAIVLPHGVLFRGDAEGGKESEGRIRKNLIEKNHIEAIIGLPANIFFGTSIPTLIMVLRQERESDDVLIVDASKGFEKQGKNNVLRACDIRRIVDAVTTRSTIPGFSRLVSKQEIRDNGYNLNIPRYVDSSEPAETWDIYATMFGGIPQGELAALGGYWSAFPGLKDALFHPENEAVCKLQVTDLRKAAATHPSVVAFRERYAAAFADFGMCMERELFSDLESVSPLQAEEVLCQDIFARLEDAKIPLVDRYEAYQMLDDAWKVIAADLEMIQTEGRGAITRVDPNMVIKTKDGKKTEVQEGWKGHILPFELVQRVLFPELLESITKLNAQQESLSAAMADCIALIPEDERGSFLNDDNSAFVKGELSKKVNEIARTITSPEIDVLQEYVDCYCTTGVSKATKLAYIEANSTMVQWEAITGKAPYTGANAKKRITELRACFSFDEESTEAVLLEAALLLKEKGIVDAAIKTQAEELHTRTKERLEAMSEVEAHMLLRLKWIPALEEKIQGLPQAAIDTMLARLDNLCRKYETTFAEVETQIAETEQSLCSMLDELCGNEFDMAGIAELKKLLGGE